MNRCDICKEEQGQNVEDALTHLKLYINGSEGCTVCLTCRMLLTEIARRMQACCHKSYLNGARDFRKSERRKSGRRDYDND